MDDPTEKAKEAEAEIFPVLLFLGNIFLRVVVLYVGVSMAIKYVNARQNVHNEYSQFQWGKAIETSKQYQQMLASIDVYNLGMFTGVALILIALFGWQYHPKKPKNLLKTIRDLIENN